MLSALFFNRSAAARLLGCKPESIVRFEIWNVVFVQVKGQRPTFISKADFYGEFFRFRQQGAESCQVTEFSAGCYPGSFDVLSDGQRWHHVRLGLGCSCRDYAEQKAQNLPHPRCKHQYAVLNHLGVSSLEEAIAKVRGEREALAAAEWRESAPVLKPPVTVSPRTLPGQYAHVSIA